MPAAKWTVHWPVPGTAGHPSALLCGQSLIIHRDMWTEQVEHLTCPDCLFRVAALLHRDIGVVFKTLAGIVETQRAQLNHAIKRD